jgi:hypothetical protein
LGSDVAFEEFVLRNKICFYPDPHLTTCELSLTPSYTILHPSQRVPLKQQHPPPRGPWTTESFRKILMSRKQRLPGTLVWPPEIMLPRALVKQPRALGPTTKDAAGHASSFPSVDAVHRMAAATAMNFIERWYRKNVCCAVCERSHATWSRAAGWNGFVGNGVYWVYSKMTIWIGEMMRNHWILGSIIFRQTHMFDSYNYDAWSLRLFGITGQWTSPTWLNFWLQPFFWEIQEKSNTVPQKAKSWLPRRFLPQLSEVILRESLVKTLS